MNGSGIFSICKKYFHFALDDMPTIERRNTKYLNIILPPLGLFALCIYNVLNSQIVYNGFMFFCIESLILVLVFEISPVIWTIFVVIEVALIGVIVAKAGSLLPILNLVIFSILVIILGFWKRYHIQLYPYQNNFVESKN